jgi:hypothetical protein
MSGEKAHHEEANSRAQSKTTYVLELGTELDDGHRLEGTIWIQFQLTVLHHVHVTLSQEQIGRRLTMAMIMQTCDVMQVIISE